MKQLVALVFACIFARTVQSAVIFSQDFSAGGSPSQYTSSTPNDGQWNAIAGNATITAGGALHFQRSSGSAYFARTTDFSPVPQVLEFRFKINAVGSSAQASVARLQVGSAFSANSTIQSAGVSAELGVSFASGGGFALRDMTLGDAGTLNGPQVVTWIINNSNSTYTYTAPNGSTQTVGAGHWDLWESGTSIIIFDERPLVSTSQPLTDMKFVFNGGSGSIEFDDFQLEAVPESRLTGLIGVAVALLAVTKMGKADTLKS